MAQQVLGAGYLKTKQSKNNSPLSGRCLESLITHAAHLLPAQGPITAFVHHNTLHSLEDLHFEQAVVKGGEIFDCNSYLPESRYRAKLDKGRIEPHDLEDTLKKDLGPEVHKKISNLGNRFEVRMAMLVHPLLTGPTHELKWAIEESDALRKFRCESKTSIRQKMIEDTRHWVMRDFRDSSSDNFDPGMMTKLLDEAGLRFDPRTLEEWDESRWESLSLRLLWLVIRSGVVRHPLRQAGHTHHKPIRMAALLKEITGTEVDERVNEILIRFCASFLDQDFAVWSLPERDKGFLHAFKNIYQEPAMVTPKWFKLALREIDQISSSLVSIGNSLNELGVSESEFEDYIASTLLALRGFAGMIWQMETRGDRVSRSAPKGSLIDYLAVRLILEKYASLELAHKELGSNVPLGALRKKLAGQFKVRVPSADQTAFVIFQIAQLMGWSADILYFQNDTTWKELLLEIHHFSSLERSRIYHLAFERRYRHQTLNAIASHYQASTECSPPESDKKSQPSFQLICCIDEREESFRRALEETDPNCETFGAAGFFAVAMNYRGAADAHYTPLCPVIIEPKHYVEERVVFPRESEDAKRRNRRRTIGTVTHRVHIGSRTFAGGMLAATLGALATIPLVMRIFYPRATARLRESMGGFVRPPTDTQLCLEREHSEPSKDKGHIGYSLDEMAIIVERLLRDVGLTSRFSKIVVIAGHGSSSLNNPHEAAHDCGACGGGRGGPNARAFAHMANHPLVRERIKQCGLTIPKETVFIGSYHNTCDESMTYYDLEVLPSSHSATFARVQDCVEKARRLNAHERCRRFYSASFSLDPEGALRHVEARAEDLSQVRPEYGHATNALCFVGRRTWSRGLFLDRRAFLQSYDPTQDDENYSILTRILQAVIPVCGGINLEYFFSYVDPEGYGCGTKLPHNITSLLGVMNGPSSDLRTGLPWQMVEIHEPVRLLFVIETTPKAILSILERHQPLAQLVKGHWVQLATLDPETREIHYFRQGKFEPYLPAGKPLPSAISSMDWYRGWRDHLAFASITPSTPKIAS